MGESAGEILNLELVAPFLPKVIVNELCSGRKWADYRARKLDLLRARIARAWQRQRVLAEREKQFTRPKFVDGAGQRKAVIDEELFAFTRAKYGRLAFHDPDHLNFILKEHPELRAPTPPPRYLMVNGFRDRHRECGAGHGARANPVTAIGASNREPGSAHEIPAPQPLQEHTYENTINNTT